MYGLAVKESLDKKLKKLRKKDREMLQLIEKKVHFREVKESDKNTAWYKKASKKPACLKAERRGKTL